MTKLISPTAIDALADRVALPRHNRMERTFDLHPALHVAVFGGFALYLAIMWAAFHERSLVIPFAIFFFFLAAFFVVPAAWVRVESRPGPFATWGDFLREGLESATGHATARETMAQVLIMPVMLVLWGVIVALIRALV